MKKIILSLISGVALMACSHTNSSASTDSTVSDSVIESTMGDSSIVGE